MRPWGTSPILAFPPHFTVPEYGTRRIRALKSVVFPPPFGPTMAKVDPLDNWKSTSSSKVLPAIFTSRFETETMGDCPCAPRLGRSTFAWAAGRIAGLEDPNDVLRKEFRSNMMRTYRYGPPVWA